MISADERLGHPRTLQLRHGRPSLHTEREEELVKPVALIGTSGAALLGALIWGGIGYATHSEIGIVAWGIGGLVGTAAVLFGLRGQQGAVIAAALTVAAIFGGKLFTIEFSARGQIAELYTKADYQEQMRDARDFPGTDDRALLETYMVEHDFAEPGVTDEEIEFFEQQWASKLTKWNANKPTIEDWREEMAAEAYEVVLNELGYFGLLKESLGFLDIIFLVLGLSTAYGLVMKNDESVTSF